MTHKNNVKSTYSKFFANARNNDCLEHKQNSHSFTSWSQKLTRTSRTCLLFIVHVTFGTKQKMSQQESRRLKLT